MDIPTLILTTYTLCKPFLEKTGEGVARKIGEDIWTLIKKPFANKGKDTLEQHPTILESEFKQELEKELLANPTLVSELTKMVNEARTSLNSNNQQNIHSYEKIEKQINIQNNTGNIQM